ncbi:hypothetical protein EMIHUDRAFT_197941 [Emiliania huxleyi CCMP1516]|uniref:SSD domain-containing protein n=2 Tax=Emiliania huxleyi TaxID=2903 RepID=A0A0D3IE00_EMIH1|nr:hypothetical protein EMIHUDRAFT_197941 [Emiliania huxleyi CCMP1516]EOD09485.1 hypothetical protein EMIHUDRAFT_197941 [Emiliania huxleyi CCMP1516]|eukprot:XP_005761914.1 hypothetical protein EMIHUDRAFT_197941 [Emiliania huxleyi CCMP1516]
MLARLLAADGRLRLHLAQSSIAYDTYDPLSYDGTVPPPEGEVALNDVSKIVGDAFYSTLHGNDHPGHIPFSRVAAERVASGLGDVLGAVGSEAGDVGFGVSSGLTSGGYMSDEERERDKEALAEVWQEAGDAVAGLMPELLPNAVTKLEAGTLRGSEQLRFLCETHLMKEGLVSLTDAAANSAAAIRRLFVGGSGASTLIAVPLSPRYKTTRTRVAMVQEYLDAAAVAAAEECLDSTQYSVLVGGDARLRIDTQQATQQDFHRVDLVSMPLAMVALFFFLASQAHTGRARDLPRVFSASLRLLLVPLICIPVSISVSLGIIRLAALAGLPIQFVVPALVCCTVVAISIDYCLFLLAAFAAARRRGEPTDTSICVALRDSGHTIIMSGVVLAAAFLATALFPLDWMLSNGLCSCASVLTTLLVNMNVNADEAAAATAIDERGVAATLTTAGGLWSQQANAQKRQLGRLDARMGPPAGAGSAATQIRPIHRTPPRGGASEAEAVRS